MKRSRTRQPLLRYWSVGEVRSCDLLFECKASAELLFFVQVHSDTFSSHTERSLFFIFDAFLRKLDPHPAQRHISFQIPAFYAVGLSIQALVSA